MLLNFKSIFLELYLPTPNDYRLKLLFRRCSFISNIQFLSKSCSCQESKKFSLKVDPGVAYKLLLIKRKACMKFHCPCSSAENSSRAENSALWKTYIQYTLDKWNLHGTEKKVPLIECSTYPIQGTAYPIQGTGKIGST